MALVLLQNCSTTMEAEVLRGLLTAHGVMAFRFDFEESCGSAFPAMARLMVAEEDLQEAATIIGRGEP